MWHHNAIIPTARVEGVRKVPLLCLLAVLCILSWPHGMWCRTTEGILTCKWFKVRLQNTFHDRRLTKTNALPPRLTSWIMQDPIIYVNLYFLVTVWNHYPRLLMSVLSFLNEPDHPKPIAEIPSHSMHDQTCTGHWTGTKFQPCDYFCPLVLTKNKHTHLPLQNFSMICGCFLLIFSDIPPPYSSPTPALMSPISTWATCRQLRSLSGEPCLPCVEKPWR